MGELGGGLHFYPPWGSGPRYLICHAFMSRDNRYIYTYMCACSEILQITQPTFSVPPEFSYLGPTFNQSSPVRPSVTPLPPPSPLSPGHPIIQILKNKYIYPFVLGLVTGICI